MLNRVHPRQQTGYLHHCCLDLLGHWFSECICIVPSFSPQRTVLRAELAAIYDALHCGHFPGHMPLHIMTDSLTLLQLTF